jgi:GTP pyrophosphokinase
VFCFTPKGRLIALPRKATPIDFAYAVHTDVGNSAIGCKINGQVAPLVSELQTGDEVEIIRGDVKSPPAAWDAIVITGKARAAIRRATRSAVRAQFTGLGRRVTERAFAKASLPFSDEKLQTVLPRLARHTLEDLYSSVGRGEIKPEDVLKAVDPEWRGERVGGAKAPKTEGGWFGLRRASSLKFRIPEKKAEEKSSAIPIRGINGELPVRFAPNGGAVPGDRIVGILTPGEGITIYPIHSSALKEFDDHPERWLDVRWDMEEAEPQRFPAQIVVTAANAPGSLAQVATVIGEHGGNIDNIRMSEKSPDFSRMMIDVEVFDLKHLNAILTQLRAKKVVSAAERVNG